MLAPGGPRGSSFEISCALSLVCIVANHIGSVDASREVGYHEEGGAGP
jgi:hypothetical protein